MIYLYYAFKTTIDWLNLVEDISNNYKYEEYLSDGKQTHMMHWIIGMIFTVMIIFISVSIMCKLRIRFDDFYADYGCFLWVIFTIQALSMLL